MIKVNNLKKYYGPNVGLEDASLEVKQGEIFGFIGPNGAGKTTLIRILLGLIEKTSGEAKIFDQDCMMDQFHINQDVGYLPSEANFFDNYKVKEVIHLYQSFKAVDSAFVAHIVEKLDINLEKRIRELSFGNKKKIGILIALMHTPKLLILDEPTSGLDPLIQSRFLDLLLELQKRGSTIFLSSHVLSEVQKVCNRVALVKAGQIILVDSVENLSVKEHKIVRLTPAIDIDLKGIENKKLLNGHTLQFEFHGNLNDLVKSLGAHEFNDIVINDVSLEDIFLSYYESGELNV
jgi:ABC-2 type transport system ATP-binding protein